MKKVLFFVFFFLIFVNQVVYSKGKQVIIINPYKDVDWEKVRRYKANLHTHTNQSDGKLNPEEVVSLYKDKGYSILSITDHNKFIFPEEEKILLIPGVEIGKNQHHILAYFDFEIPENVENIDEETIIKNISEKNGFSVFAHPNRYKKEIGWYVNLFKKYSNLIGIEVLNPSVQIKNGKIFGDTDIWDDILKKTMPDRPVWGFGNDDFHDMSQFSINWNEFLIEKIDKEKIRKAMKKGEFYICSAIKGYDMPVIKKIVVDEKKGKIEIKCENYKEIKWVSDGKFVGYGEKINYRENSDIKRYLRVEIYGEKCYIYLNPFGIKEIK